MTSRRTYSPSFNTLACSQAEIKEPVLEYINLSYLAQNHSSITRLKQFNVCNRCQIYNST